MMTESQVIEGNAEEIFPHLQKNYAGRKLRAFVEPEVEEEDLAANLPDPPDTIRDCVHLIELLHEGMKGDLHLVTEQEWAELRAEVWDSLAQRKQ